ncbi:MAG: hypothetical protein IBJ00_04170 [Alphaproteobacteria bacterium]|nr:hypothetical protein [Alphaproteobacteria bacterium]
MLHIDPPALGFRPLNKTGKMMMNIVDRKPHVFIEEMTVLRKNSVKSMDIFPRQLDQIAF